MKLVALLCPSKILKEPAELITLIKARARLEENKWVNLKKNPLIYESSKDRLTSLMIIHQLKPVSTA